MKRLFFAPLALALTLGLAACDSNDKKSDKDAFVGIHTVTKIEHNVTGATGTDLTRAVICSPANAGPTQTNPCAVNTITFQFRDNGTYALNVDYTSIANAAPASQGGRQDVTFDNNKTKYTINESAKTISLDVAPTASAPVTPVQASYAIDANNQISLSLPAAVFNTIFGTTQYQGLVRVTLS